MTVKKVGAIRGRSEKSLNWDLIDNLLIAGCSGVEIAAHINIHFNTIYVKALSQHGVTWTEYSQKLKQKGDTLIRAAQFAKATGSSVKGDNTMLIWLGKNRLNQKDNPDSHLATEETLKQFNTLMANFAAFQSTLNGENKTPLDGSPTAASPNSDPLPDSDSPQNSLN